MKVGVEIMVRNQITKDGKMSLNKIFCGVKMPLKEILGVKKVNLSFSKLFI